MRDFHYSKLRADKIVNLDRCPDWIFFLSLIIFVIDFTKITGHF